MNKIKKIARGIWKGLEQRENKADWTWSGLGTQGGGAQEEKIVALAREYELENRM